MQWRIQYSSGGVVHTGCIWFVAFLYQVEVRASNGGFAEGRGKPKWLCSVLLSSGGLLGLGVFPGLGDFIGVLSMTFLRVSALH